MQGWRQMMAVLEKYATQNAFAVVLT